MYCLGKDDGDYIIESIDQGPFKLPTTQDVIGTTDEGQTLGPPRTKLLSELTDEEKKRRKADIRAANILLQGLPKDIYGLINHYTTAKEIWDNVIMLLEGSELTVDERESQLYEAFEHFKQNKGESINDYYVRFSKLLNDMRNIKMTMPQIQLNSKFVNNMLPEWGRFVTAVKLNRGLKEPNHDQLFAYLKQHEAHANEDKLLMEKMNLHSNDPLAFVSNASAQQFSSHAHPSNYADHAKVESGFTSNDDAINNLTKQVALLTQQYKAHFPQTNNQLRTTSNPRNQATVQHGRIVVQNVQGRGQGNNARGAVVGNRGAQNRGGNGIQGQAKPIKCFNCNGIGHIARECTQPPRTQNSDYFKDVMLLMQAKENGAALDEEEQLFLSAAQGNSFDDDVDDQVQDMAENTENTVNGFQADLCDAYDSDIDEAPAAQTLFMANLTAAGPVYDDAGPSYDSDSLSEVHDLDNLLDNLKGTHENQEIQSEVQLNDVVESDTEHMSNGNIIPYEQYLKENEEEVVKNNVSSDQNDALNSLMHDMCEQIALCMSANEENKVVNSLKVELACYKDQVEMYEKMNRLSFTDRERELSQITTNEIRVRVAKEESLKNELNSLQTKFNSMILHNKAMSEQVNFLKKDCQIKENKFQNKLSYMKKAWDCINEKCRKIDNSQKSLKMMCNTQPPEKVYAIAIGDSNPYYQRRPRMRLALDEEGPEVSKASARVSVDNLETAE